MTVLIVHIDSFVNEGRFSWLIHIYIYNLKYFLSTSRPWYAEAAAQEPKDVVLVIDTSETLEGASIALAKAAAIIVLETLNPNDRVQRTSDIHLTYFPFIPLNVHNQTTLAVSSFTAIETWSFRGVA